MKKDTVRIAVVDDHKLFRSGLINLIHTLDPTYKVVAEADNGKAFVDLMTAQLSVDILLLDANMPLMNGFETAEFMRENYPEVKVLIISMNNDERSLVRMLKLGVKGYIGKDIEPAELKQAIQSLMQKGFHYTDQLTGQLIQSLQTPHINQDNQAILTEQELKFIALACSEDTYAQIADTMCLSPKTIDGYRASVFEKLELKSRVGLAIYAIKNGLVDV